MKSTLEELNRNAAPPPPSASAESSIQESVSAFIHAREASEYERAQWFHQLSANDRRLITELLRECAEKATFSVFTIIDGVAGEVPGVFEITEIDGDDRQVINPENSEMLHDLFSEICEADRFS